MPSSKVLGRIGTALRKAKRSNSFAVLIVAMVVIASVVLVAGRTSPGEQESAQAEEPPDGRGYIAITFDDGSKSVIQHGYPIMSAAGVPGTVFVVTDAINDIFEGRPCMNASDLLFLQANGWEIGSHSKTHTDFSSLSPEDVMFELRESKNNLESIGINCTTFSYPWGRFDERNVAAAAEVYDRQRSGDGGTDTRGLNLRDYSPGIPVVGSVTPESPEQAKELIDKAVATDSLLVLMYHDVSPSGDLGTSMKETNLKDIVDYIVAKQQSDGLRTITFNDLPTKAAESYVWDGGGDDELASTKENWYKVDASGQIADDAPLASGAHYIWNGTSSKNCTWDLEPESYMAHSFTIAHGYVGTVQQGSVDIDLGVGGYYQGGGTFVGDRNRAVHNAGSVTVLSGTLMDESVNWNMTGDKAF